tara:strand:- start:1597 stop:1995 length:399 start_codon:yes stop_codon:yes gene_type:complete
MFFGNNFDERVLRVKFVLKVLLIKKIKKMEVQFNTDNNIEDPGRVSDFFSPIIEKEFKRFNSYITRLEVHLSDENGIKDGLEDKKCVIEARLKGKKPIVVTNLAGSNELAIKGSIDKMKTSIDSILGKLKSY